MIELVCPTSEHDAATVLPEIFRFRHRVFIERARWEIRSYQGMEFDRFDTPDARYVLWRDDASRIRGMSRLIPTTVPYMIKELWPDLLEKRAPVSPRVWEISRFGIDPAVPASLRPKITSDIVQACLEVGLDRGVDEYLAVMPPLLARRIVGDSGWSFAACGPTRKLGRYRVEAIRMDVTPEALETVRERAAVAELAMHELPWHDAGIAAHRVGPTAVALHP